MPEEAPAERDEAAEIVVWLTGRARLDLDRRGRAQRIPIRRDQVGVLGLEPESRGASRRVRLGRRHGHAILDREEQLGNRCAAQLRAALNGQL
jgi:hypothetical protein